MRCVAHAVIFFHSVPHVCAGLASCRSFTCKDVKPFTGIDHHLEMTAQIPTASFVVPWAAHVTKDWHPGKTHRPCLLFRGLSNVIGPIGVIFIVELLQDILPKSLVALKGIDVYRVVREGNNQRK